MDLDLIQRRKEMLIHRAAGTPITQWRKKMAEKYGVSENALSVDWRRRNEWIPKLLNLDDANKIVDTIIENLQVAMQLAFRREADPKTSRSTKPKFIHNINETARNLIEILQSVGRVEKVASRIEQTVEHKKSVRELLEEIYPPK